ncbi:MAG: indolepyruvate ferredoxin oxidoreductase subunit alpha [Oscillospiraceae bacterium]|nr:indolepyruvate ferredoxin oxidoreductase subunit alpha [Oscillospiraceae bacterium]
MKKMMLGNEAVARGLYEAGCTFVSSYPGTPSTEITKYAAEYEEIYAEWAPNEKVAAESAFGASVAGARAFSGMKHVGLNVAADPLFTAAYTGVNGGLVIAVADDMGMHSSQNEQDSRHYAMAAKIPMLEPADSQECKDFTKLAFELSERFDTPVFVRLSTRISHAQTPVELGERQAPPLRVYEKNVGKYVMMPAMARARHAEVEKHIEALGEWCETADINRIEWGTERKIGVVAAGIAYQTAREAFGDTASYLKLGMVYPLPVSHLKELASKVDVLYVVEELDDFIETHCKKHGVSVVGKAELSPLGEYTVPQLRKLIGFTDVKTAAVTPPPPRPPVLCVGCPHRGPFYVMNKLKLAVTGDIGCYTLGAAKPLDSMDVCLCMGASVSSLHGLLKARPEMAERTVAVIGDSTFVHSGVTGLINAVYNQSASTVMILDNRTTGMTGHQANPVTGETLKGKPAPVLDLEALCRGCGVNRVSVVDAHDITGIEKALREELAADEPSVIIVLRPCALLKNVEKKPPLVIENCKKCKICLRIGCPAMHTAQSGATEIDESQCVGCGLCAKLCRFGAIREVN